MRIFIYYFILSLFLSPSWAAEPPVYAISTYAGTGQSGLTQEDEQAATAAQLDLPAAVYYAPDNNIYIADKYNHRIRKITAEGIISTFAGTGESGFSGDGSAAIDAQLNAPTALTMDQAGTLYIADTGNHIIRKVLSDGSILTVAGTAGKAGSTGDGGMAIAAKLKLPHGLAIADTGQLYIADTHNHRIRVVTPDGVIQRFAGARRGYSGNGSKALSARLKRPMDVAVDSIGQVYIADTGNHQIRRVNTKNIIEAIAGTGKVGYQGDGASAKRALLQAPQGIFLSKNGSLFIADTYNQRIRHVDTAGIIYTVAGSGVTGAGHSAYGGDDGFASLARLANPQKITGNPQGDLFIADTNNQRIRRLHIATDANIALIHTVAGSRGIGLSSGAYGGDGKAASKAYLSGLNGLSFDTKGNLYIADTGNHVIRKINTAGMISTIVGRGVRGKDLKNGAPRQVYLQAPRAVLAATDGSLYIADSGNHRILKLQAGKISLVAGTGRKGSSGDGASALSARLNQPRGLAFDANNQLFIADSGNHRIRRIDSQGIIYTAVGTGQAGDTGDGSSASQAQLNTPQGIVFNANGDLFIADHANYKIRRVNQNHEIDTVVGTGQQGGSLDGTIASNSPIFAPSGIVIDQQDRILFSEFGSDRVRRVNNNGQLQTLAGSGALGFGGDGGIATAAQLHAPTGIALDKNALLYIADTYNHRVRTVQTHIAAIEAPSISKEPTIIDNPQNVLFKLNIHGEGTVLIKTAEGKIQHCAQAHCTAEHPNGAQITLIASTPAGGAAFQTWQNCITSTTAQINVVVTEGSVCEAVFAEPTTDITETETPKTDSTKPVNLIQKTLLSVLTLPPLCAGVDIPHSLDLATPNADKTTLHSINNLPSMQQANFILKQNAQHGYLTLKLPNLQVNLHPFKAELNTADLIESPHLRIDDLETVYFILEGGLHITTQPALQNPCALRQHASALGLPKLSILDNGNLQLRPVTSGDWYSLRPDWVVTPQAEQQQQGLLSVQYALPNDAGAYASLALLFKDKKGQTQYQLLYPAPADNVALQQAVDQLQQGIFGEIHFRFQAKNYRGHLHYRVQTGTAGNFSIEAIADQNADGLDDFMIHYPNGDQQWLWAIKG